MTDYDEIRYAESMRRYQVATAAYEKAVQEYQEKLYEADRTGGMRPMRPIPPILPVRPVRLAFAKTNEEPAADDDSLYFNAGVEAAARALESVSEHSLADWVRKHKK